MFKKGETGDKFYIILEGKIGIYDYVPNTKKKRKQDPDYVTIQRVELKDGQSFGELGLLGS